MDNQRRIVYDGEPIRLFGDDEPVFQVDGPLIGSDDEGPDIEHLIDVARRGATVRPSDGK